MVGTTTDRLILQGPAGLLRKHLENVVVLVHEVVEDKPLNPGAEIWNTIDIAQPPGALICVGLPEIVSKRGCIKFQTPLNIYISQEIHTWARARAHRKQIGQSLQC